LRTGLLALLVGFAVCCAAVLAPSTVRGSSSVTIRVLFDLGDGSYLWASETMTDPAATNATWHAVEQAASRNRIALTSTWTQYGVGILDVGGRHPPAGFVGLLLWNGTSHAWDYAPVGISSLVLQDGDAIALYDAAFATTPPYASRMPVPTVDHPRPSTEFRGDLSNSGLAGSSAPDRIRVLWDHDTGMREIGSTPAVAFGRVFVATMGGMLAMDAATGSVVWSNPNARGFSSPAVYNDSVYVGTSNGSVIRLNAADGSVLWETRLLANPSFSGITSSPKILYDRLFVGTFNETGGPGEVVALSEGNGSVLWRHGTGSVHFSSPAYANGTLYVGIMGRYNKTSQITFDAPFGVLALDANSGDQRWFYSTGGSVAASPAIAGETVIVPSKDGKVVALNRTTGAFVWRVDVSAGISSPAVVGDTVFIGGGAFGSPGHVVALDAASGSVKWSFNTTGPVQSSPTYAGGTLVFSTNEARGTIYGLNATTGTVSWSFVPLPSDYILGGPAVADGIVFAPSDNGHVVALGAALPYLPPEGGAFSFLWVGAGVLVAAVIGIAVWVVLRRRPRLGP
jgi:outer membrane protein assembly factor BamB